MSTVTSSTRLPSPHGQTEEVDLFSATEAKSRFSQLIESVRQHQKVVISRNDKATAVLISIEDYAALVASIPDPLEPLRRQFSDLLQAISSTTATASAALHTATSAELGEAAHAAATNVSSG